MNRQSSKAWLLPAYRHPDHEDQVHHVPAPCRVTLEMLRLFLPDGLC